MNQITVHGKTYNLPENPVWHEGPPPEIGWWPTHVGRHKPIIIHLRFFNGKAWSTFCVPHETSDEAGRDAERDPHAWSIKAVRWAAQWWKFQP